MRGDGMPAPLFAFRALTLGARVMTLLEPLPTNLARDRHAVVLETPRLILRTPRPEDAGAIAALANDRRVVENTARLPFPYTVRDAEQFIDYATQEGGEIGRAS